MQSGMSLLLMAPGRIMNREEIRKQHTVSQFKAEYEKVFTVPALERKL